VSRFEIDAPEVQVITASTTGGDPRILVRTSDLLPLLPEGGPFDSFYLSHVAVNPADPNSLAVIAVSSRRETSFTPPPANTAYVFLVNRKSGEISLRWQIDQLYTGLEFSPDGRWLMATAFEWDRGRWSLHLHDMEQNQTRTFTSGNVFTPYPNALPTYDWSADGQWLLLVDDGVMTLIAPAYDYQKPIVPASPGCVFAAWINRE
jgi:hypothetical protein